MERPALIDGQPMWLYHAFGRNDSSVSSLKLTSWGMLLLGPILRPWDVVKTPTDPVRHSQDLSSLPSVSDPLAGRFEP